MMQTIIIMKDSNPIMLLSVIGKVVIIAKIVNLSKKGCFFNDMSDEKNCKYGE